MNNGFVKKILILSANPKNSVPLRLGEEVREIEEGLTRAKKRDQFELKQKWAVQPKDMQQAISEFKPQIVHFSGHGAGRDGLVFEDKTGQAKLVSTSALAALFELFADQIECVVLNACYSEIQAEVIAQYIPYVIGMNQAVGDQAAIAFAVGFYDALGGGEDFESAYKHGCVAIKMEGITDNLTPVLKRRSNSHRSGDNSSIIKRNGYFYVVGSRLENRGCEGILKPGNLIRIKSPDKMGKTLMMSRIIDFAKQYRYRTAIVDLREVNQEHFSDINRFLQWLCACVSDQLDIAQDPQTSWPTYLGANLNCTKFFKNHFLSANENPLVIAFDNFDCIFRHPSIEVDFCSLLRGWFERAKTDEVWGNLRQIIVYKQKYYATKNLDMSPLNVGLPVELDELNSSELISLINAYGLSWTNEDITKLMHTIGGHPYLVQLALDQIIHQSITLDKLLKIAPTEEGIYKNYLNERLRKLEESTLTMEAMRVVVNSDRPVRLGSMESFKLDSMGLIKQKGNDVVPRCNLYRWYFKDMLSK